MCVVINITKFMISTVMNITIFTVINTVILMVIFNITIFTVINTVIFMVINTVIFMYSYSWCLLVFMPVCFAGIRCQCQQGTLHEWRVGVDQPVEEREGRGTGKNTPSEILREAEAGSVFRLVNGYSERISLSKKGRGGRGSG